MKIGRHHLRRAILSTTNWMSKFHFTNRPIRFPRLCHYVPISNLHFTLQNFCQDEEQRKLKIDDNVIALVGT